ncbi:hypothetical protein [Streptomyces kronopolitis]|uniref:hypothetical protein n=1 Tax=Streptomyces kronopolitis TaxID=1612435 RepID=UPI003D961493
MGAPGFRSRIATGLLVASVVLPVPLGATSAVAADRRATPVDRPPNLARQDDPHDDGSGDDYGADDFGPDGYGEDDPAPGPPRSDGRGRVHHGHSGPSARELPDRIPGLPYAFPGFPHRSPHHHPGGRRGYGEWRHRPHRPFGPDFPGPMPPYGLPGTEDGGGDLSWRGHHGPPGPPGPPDADRAHPRPGRHAPRKHHQPAASGSRAPAGSDASRRHNVADRRPVRSYESLPPLPPVVPKKQGGSVPDGADGEAAVSDPSALETPTAPVERVLPLGAGLALTGLGLAFFALRLRRS